MGRLVENLPNVSLHRWQGLIVDIAEELNIRVILRGVRALSDFNYEFELSMMNKRLNPHVETVFLPTDQKYFVLRSSGIKELASLGGDVSGMVPPLVRKALAKKMKKVDNSQ